MDSKSAECDTLSLGPLGFFSEPRGISICLIRHLFNQHHQFSVSNLPSETKALIMSTKWWKTGPIYIILSTNEILVFSKTPQ